MYYYYDGQLDKLLLMFERMIIMIVDYYSYTDVGDRENNEDCFLVLKTIFGYVIAVADGLGGHGKGEIASLSVCDSVRDFFENCENLDLEKIEDAYDYFQEVLHTKQSEYSEEGIIKTTLALVCIDDKKIYISHIGDTRVYLYSKNGRLTRTVDHSVSQVLCTMGEIEESEIRYHEDRNKLIRVLGMEDVAPKPEIEKPIDIEETSKILICTDGLWEHLNERDICDVVKEGNDSKSIVENLVEIVHKNSGMQSMDNNTAVVVCLTQ